MPHLHFQLAGQQQSPDGKIIAIQPASALVSRGPCLQVSINIAIPIAEQLLQKGEALPEPISGLALIDTGATSTCIDIDAAQKLGVPAVDVVYVASASHHSTPQNVYPVSLEIIGLPINIDAPRAIGASLASQGLLVLIGRDVLQHCTLFYNGIAGQITLAV